MDDSYLRSRDSSEYYSMSSSSSEKEEKHVNVYLRIKACVEISRLYTISDATFTCHLSGHHDENYKFTKIFKQESTQQHIFVATVKEKLRRFIDGKNSTLMTYGCSGSGKTFTLIGTPDEPGIIPRSIKYLFASLPTLENYPQVKLLANGQVVSLNEDQKLKEKLLCSSILKDMHGLKHHAKAFSTMQERLSIEPVAVIDNITPIMEIWVSLYEIYNEQIFDLLQPVTRGQCRPKLKIGGIHDNMYIKDLRHIYVRSGLEAYQVLQYGLENRSKASTSINLHSSRSHCIFNIKLVQGHNCDNVHVSSINFCDLAGSERLKNTLNNGDRLKESSCINSSLLVLRRCITMVRNSQNKKENTIPPFRESKLTQLFQMALTGKEDIHLMVNINPSTHMFTETHHTLNFSSVAKEVLIDDLPLEGSTHFDHNRNYHEASEDKIIEELIARRDEFRERTEKVEEENNKIRDEIAELVLKISEEKLQTEQYIDEQRNIFIKENNKIIHGMNDEIEKLKKRNEELLKIKRELQKKTEYICIISSDSSDDTDEGVEDEGDSDDYSSNYEVLDYEESSANHSDSSDHIDHNDNDGQTKLP
ncbi:kinesin-like protein subito [Rhynchophorus ferrugineus]|uniref:kinesin-like protein subito n=1 Tax=Rhynchophorus ferrugineus TaxID=354439 RepID=UPI003FCDC79F